MAKFMLDGGHGYSTAGKRSIDGMREYEFNRAVANYAKAELSAYQNTEVIFSHNDSRDVPLIERTNLAKRERVDAVVSIHANAFGNGRTWVQDVDGVETFVYQKGRNAKADQLAREVNTRIVRAGGLDDRGVKAANFHMVREPVKAGIPAILVECGFMTDREDTAKLRSDAYRRACGKAIADGLAVTFKLVRKPVPKPAPKPVTGAKTHTVKAGDSLWKVATNNGLTVEQLRKFNAGKDLDPLQIGTVLFLTKSYVVKKGDTLWQIARDNGTTVDKLRALNAKKDLEPLQIGTVLIVG